VTPLVFTKVSGGQTVTTTLTPLGSIDLEFRLSVNGVEVPQDTDVAEFECSADRDRALADMVALYESSGFTRVA
jgi:hypothetical protein